MGLLALSSPWPKALDWILMSTAIYDGIKREILEAMKRGDTALRDFARVSRPNSIVRATEDPYPMPTRSKFSKPCGSRRKRIGTILKSPSWTNTFPRS